MRMTILADGLSSFRPPFPRTPFSPAIYLFRWRGNNLENQRLKITVADTLCQFELLPRLVGDMKGGDGFDGVAVW